MKRPLLSIMALFALSGCQAPPAASSGPLNAGSNGHLTIQCQPSGSWTIFAVTEPDKSLVTKYYTYQGHASGDGTTCLETVEGSQLIRLMGQTVVPVRGSDVFTEAVRSVILGDQESASASVHYLHYGGDLVDNFVFRNLGTRTVKIDNKDVEVLDLDREESFGPGVPAKETDSLPIVNGVVYLNPVSWAGNYRQHDGTLVDTIGNATKFSIP